MNLLHRLARLVIDGGFERWSADEIADFWAEDEVTVEPIYRAHANAEPPPFRPDRQLIGYIERKAKAA